MGYQPPRAVSMSISFQIYYRILDVGQQTSGQVMYTEWWPLKSSLVEWVGRTEGRKTRRSRLKSGNKTKMIQRQREKITRHADRPRIGPNCWKFDRILGNSIFRLSNNWRRCRVGRRCRFRRRRCQMAIGLGNVRPIRFAQLPLDCQIFLFARS